MNASLSLDNAVGFLILFPVLVAFLLWIPIRSDRLRAALVSVAAVALIGVSISLLFNDYPTSGTAVTVGEHPAELIGQGMLWIEVLLAAVILYICIRAKRILAPILLLGQLGLLAWFEHANAGQLYVAKAFTLDKFSVIMALIIGIIGSLICVFALGYMKEFHNHHHPEMKDRRPFFFFLITVFLGAMFGIIFANNLLWMYFFWEVTTLCSFFLIGYKGDKESVNNAFRALNYNLLGGLAFVLAIVVLFNNRGTLSMDQFTVVDEAGKAALLLPAALLSFAGMTKSAQMPFSKWLLGAMVAPTPVSALLHSSTMVKAGVYVIVRMSPTLQDTTVGKLVALVGAITFLVTSLIAVSQSNAKKVLAYSTIANLGLIVMCAGIGTPEAVWAAVMLIIFHAVAKALLFLCVGVVEHKIHSRDIEDMSGLIVTMPKLAIMLQIGMAGMFLAPFGMLVSKWAAMKALVDSNALFVVFVVFGSAVTLLFWVKWMGKLLQITKPHQEYLEKNISGGEWTALVSLAIMTVGACMFFPIISKQMVDPFVGMPVRSIIGDGNITIMLIMLGMVALFPLSFFNYGRRVRVVDPYLGGANAEGGMKFTGSAGAVPEMTMKNYYLSSWFGEEKLFTPGMLCTSVVLVLMLAPAAVNAVKALL